MQLESSMFHILEKEQNLSCMSLPLPKSILEVAYCFAVAFSKIVIPVGTPRHPECHLAFCQKLGNVLFFTKEILDFHFPNIDRFSRLSVKTLSKFECRLVFVEEGLRWKHPERFGVV